MPERERVYAAGRLLFEGGKFVATDRLGSVVYKFGTGLAVQNGGFETGVMAPWAPYGGAQHTITMTPHSGSYALRQTIATTEGGAYQDVKGLVAGMSYQFRAWVRSETGLVNGALAVSDTVGNNLAWTGVQPISNSWREFVVTFTATGQGIARIHLVQWGTTGALLWDDVELVNGATATSGLKMRYYPYGQEVGTATANDVAKFGTYTRDAGSGLDYAMNRYYQSTWGRFTSPDQGPPAPCQPQSWNRYSYTWGDPTNAVDPDGMLPSICGLMGGGGYQCGGTPDWYYLGSGAFVYSPTLSPLGYLARSVDIIETFADYVSPNPNGGYTIQIDADFYEIFSERFAKANPMEEALRLPGVPWVKVLAVTGALLYTLADWWEKRRDRTTCTIKCQIVDFRQGYDNAVGYMQATQRGISYADACALAKQEIDFKINAIYGTGFRKRHCTDK